MPKGEITPHVMEWDEAQHFPLDIMKKLGELGAILPEQYGRSALLNRGALIGCGPGMSEDSDQVTVSSINRNYKGRSGTGKLWLASPLSVAASAFTGTITAYTPGMFAKRLVTV